jgi:hypothetical protein
MFHLLAGRTQSGIYSIDPDEGGSNTPLDVYCDMQTDGGGWTFFLRVNDDSTPTNYFQADVGTYQASRVDDGTAYGVGGTVLANLAHTEMMGVIDHPEPNSSRTGAFFYAAGHSAFTSGPVPCSGLTGFAYRTDVSGAYASAGTTDSCNSVNWQPKTVGATDPILYFNQANGGTYYGSAIGGDNSWLHDSWWYAREGLIFSDDFTGCSAPTCGGLYTTAGSNVAVDTGLVAIHANPFSDVEGRAYIDLSTGPYNFDPSKSWEIKTESATYTEGGTDDQEWLLAGMAAGTGNPQSTDQDLVGVIAVRHDGGATKGYAIVYKEGANVWVIGNVAERPVGATIYNIALRVSGSRADLYIDGVHEDRVVLPGTVTGLSHLMISTDNTGTSSTYISIRNHGWSVRNL